jgi:hypothetical protein
VRDKSRFALPERFLIVPICNVDDLRRLINRSACSAQSAYYSNLIELTVNVSPCTSPFTSTRRWSFFVDDLRAATNSLFPAASNFKNFLSAVRMP